MDHIPFNVQFMCRLSSTAGIRMKFPISHPMPAVCSGGKALENMYCQIEIRHFPGQSGVNKGNWP